VFFDCGVMVILRYRLALEVEI